MDDDGLGPNAWLVDEMRAQWLTDPLLVSESWRAYFAARSRSSAANEGLTAAPVTVGFAGRVPVGAVAPSSASTVTIEAVTVEAMTSATPPALSAPTPAPNSASPAIAHVRHVPAAPAGVTAEALKGVGARIVANMEASLGVPTATSVRDVAARLLEVERNIINNHLRRTRGGKVSFTHLISFAVVRAIASVPAMKNTYTEDDKGGPQIVRHPHIGLGIAVDVANADGTRSLMVPNIRHADEMDFREFHAAYETLIAKVRNKKLTADDLAGVTVSITNPGTIGTRHSVPRLMPGQAVIVGVGAIDFPAEFAGADLSKLADIGIGKTVTLTSTYDHRIIQGAESGMFLDHIRALIMGEEGFYEEVFGSLGVPYKPATWFRDQNPADATRAAVEKAAAIQEVVNAYRSRGHLIADLDPLDAKGPQLPSELDPNTYGLSLWDLDRAFYTTDIAGSDTHKLGDLLGILRDAYCRTVGIEYMHIMDPHQKKWIQREVEGVDTTLEVDEQRHILTVLNKAEAFEKFLHRRYTGQKRFGLEGGEAAMVVLDAVLDGAGTDGMSEAVVGMPHRGRLNTLVNIVGKSVNQVFREFEDMTLGTVYGGGDVKYHLGATGKYTGISGNSVAVSLAPNPSHLEAVDPVVEGIVRAKQDEINSPDDFPVLPLLMHGDAAFIGQGVVAETLNLSQLRGYMTGGTIHLVINNQVGFTTNPESARSSVYCTDVAKMVQAPIFHVNGDDPEACYRVGQLAFKFRQAFKKDVVIDMVCYRKHGHNEGDEPRYTQPLMYERIDSRPSVRELYTTNLVGRNDITQEEADRHIADFEMRMQGALDETRAEKETAVGHREAANADDNVNPFAPVETGVERELLDRIARATHSWPASFNAHPKLAKQLETRAQSYAQTGEVDWALAEAMAYGSMMLEGTLVRVTGQDSRRGTFSHRQAVMVDSETGDEWTPLANLDPAQGRFFIYDSSLSEYAVLGFEYGYTVHNQEAFVAWEAQFGDFINGAQIMIDQFLVSSETKWGQQSQLTLLLPHGYEGQGPEHSSARVERFLQLCAEDNIRVVNCTTAAQLFHVLRRQVHAPIRKPLVVIAPKSGLRAKQTRSNVNELVSGAFREVLDDATILDPLAVKRVVLCSGKVAWDAFASRDAAGKGALVAIVRVEQLYPLPIAQIADLLSRYPNASQVSWLQEEPENQGPWLHVQQALWLMTLADPSSKRNLALLARPASGSTATGSHHQHDHELEMLKDGVVRGLL